MTNSPSFTNFNSPNLTRTTNSNFTSTLNPNAPMFNPGIQNFNATAINNQLPIINNSANLPSNTPTNIPSFSPVSSSNVPRYNPYLLDGNDLTSNGQNGNFVQQAGHNDNSQQSLQFHQQLPFMHSSPFVRTVPDSQHQGQNGFVHGQARNEENFALICMLQHTDKQIMEEKKRIQALNKRDSPEFLANKDLTPEEYIEYRQYFLMIA